MNASAIGPLLLAVCCWLTGVLPAATASPDAQLGVLPNSCPLALADFAPDARIWEMGLHQQIGGLPPRAGQPGFELHATALELGVLRGLSFVAGRDERFSVWRRLALAGHATVGATYGKSHQGGLFVNGLFGNLRGDFGLQLLREPAGRWRQLCGVFGGGADYTVVTITGRGPNADVVTSFTYVEGGLQATFSGSPAWCMEPFFMVRGGVQNTGVHEAGRVRARTGAFYRLMGGMDWAWRWDAERPENQVAVQGAVAYSDRVGWTLNVGVVFRHGF